MCEGTYSGHGLQANNHQAVFSGELGEGGTVGLDSFDDINGDLRPLSAAEDFVLIGKQEINPARWDFSRQYRNVSLHFVYTPADGHIEYHHTKDNIAYVAKCRLAKLKTPGTASTTNSGSSDQSTAAPPAATGMSPASCEAKAKRMAASTCSVAAGVMFGPDGDAVSQLLMTGSFTWSAEVEGGTCWLTITADGVVRGNSHHRSFKCEVSDNLLN